jgi:nucleoside-diphosphate-sugar epimerase
LTTTSSQKIAVTGASGFVGRYLVKELLDAGKQVVAVVRNPNKVPELKRAGIELRVADLSDTARDDAKHFSGCDAVIANAGQVSFNRDYGALIRQNSRRYKKHTASLQRRWRDARGGYVIGQRVPKSICRACG